MNPLDYLYSFMGWVTLHTGRMTRRSVNLIPSNVILMGLCLISSPVCYFSYQGPSDWWLLVLSLFSFFVFVVLLTASLLGHTVFQRKNGTTPMPAPLANFDGSVLFNGNLRLYEKTRRRFLGVPAHIVTLEDGNLGFASLIDASSTLYGFVLSQQKGVWYSVPTPGSLELTNGIYYRGAKGYPALRLSYTEKLGSSHQTQSAIVGFASEAARETARAWFADKVNPPFD